MVDKEKGKQPESQYGQLMTAKKYEQAAELAMSGRMSMAKHEAAAINALSEKLKRGSIRDVNTAYAFAKYHSLSDHVIEKPVRAAAEYRLRSGDIDVFDRISEIFGFKPDAKREMIGNTFVYCLEAGRLERGEKIKARYPTEMPEKEREFALDAFAISLSAGKIKAAEKISEYYGFTYKEEFPLAKGAYELSLQEQNHRTAEAIKVRYPKVAG